MGSRWDGRLADAVRMALETGNEFGKQARQLGAELIGAGSATDGLATIDPALLSGYVGKRNQRRIMELAAAPGAIDKSIWLAPASRADIYC